MNAASKNAAPIKLLFIRASLASIVFALALVGCNGGGGGGGVPTVTLKSIAVTPVNPSIALKTRLQLIATGTYSDNTTKNITTQVTWSSSNTAAASVAANYGLVTPAVAAAAGQTSVITATSGTVTASTTTTLTAALPPLALTGCTTQTSTGCEPLAFQQWGLLNTGQTGFADTSGVASSVTPGTDINVSPVYAAGGSGYGVTVAVVDSGLEIAHEDLDANVVPGGSWNFINNTTDPTSTVTTGDHGTMVSGLIAMARNGIGGIGVASSAQLKGFNFLGGSSTATLANQIASLGGSTASPNSSDVAVFNQSYGTGSTVDYPVDPAVELQLASGTGTLRGGKGALYVKAAGNGFVGDGANFPKTCGTGNGNNIVGISCQNANFDPENTLPYNIVMAALNANGTRTSYSTAGSAIWASAPGGEAGYNAAALTYAGYYIPPPVPVGVYDPAMVTTDQSGCTKGESVSLVAGIMPASFSFFNWGGTSTFGGLFSWPGINANCNYTNGMNGTSSATPMMTGSIALILEANPALTWRDVKYILAKTAVKVDPSIPAVSVTLGSTGPYVAEQTWTPNFAGFNYQNSYGFGAVDVGAAVALAKGACAAGCGLGTFANTGWIDSGVLSLAIPDNSTAGASKSFTVIAGTGGVTTVEAVQIQLTTSATQALASTSGCTNTTDGCTGDIGIELTSPSGTRSVLKNIQDGFNGFFLSGMVLASNAFYGEPIAGVGTWTVKVVDGWTGHGTQTLTNVQIRVYGH